MTTTLNLKPKAVPVQDAPAGAMTLQERIDAMVAEAVKRRPPPLSAEAQREKNQAAIDMLRQWREEDATDDPEEIAKSLAEWEEFKKSMNENHSSNRVLFP
jgi:hypothetical protein